LPPKLMHKLSLNLPISAFVIVIDDVGLRTYRRAFTVSRRTVDEHLH